MMPAVATTDVFVAHEHALIAAGLVSILQRMPGCAIKAMQWQADGGQDMAQAGAAAQIVFADAACATRLVNDRVWTAAGTHPRLVMVTSGRSATEMPPGCLRAGIDGCLSVDCAEEEVFDTVRRLADGNGALAGPAGARNRPTGGIAPHALRRVQELIEGGIADALPMRQLAAVTGLSEGHFSRAFKQSTGMPPRRYILRRRIARAADLLRDTNRLLTDIALDVGFADQSHFTRSFLGLHGETPSRFRHRHR